MGIYQEVLYKRYGKHPREALFYTVILNKTRTAPPVCVHYNLQFHLQHLLPLPGFLLLYRNIIEHIEISSLSPEITVPILGASMPSSWVYLIGNVLTQYICISQVYVLTTECSSLTVTLVVTLRKFVSLLFSIVYFRNPFTIYHWIGTLLVFTGTVIFTEIIPRIQNAVFRTKHTSVTATNAHDLKKKQS